MACRGGCSSVVGPTTEDKLRKEVKKMKAERDKITQMLCDLCKVVTSCHPNGPVQLEANNVLGLREWYYTHKELDDTRRRKDEEKKEKVKQGALRRRKKKILLDSLSKEDKDLLGL